MGRLRRWFLTTFRYESPERNQWFCWAKDRRGHVEDLSALSSDPAPKFAKARLVKDPQFTSFCVVAIQLRLV